MIEAWVTLAVGVPAVVLAFVQTQQTKRQRVRDFELTYVQRYWQLYDRTVPFVTQRVGRSVSEELLTDDQYAALMSYIDLCEDELDVRAAGWISDATWVQWRSGIVVLFMSQPYRSVWDRVKDAEPNRYQSLRAAQAQHECGNAVEPCELSSARRRWRGLSGRG